MWDGSIMINTVSRDFDKYELLNNSTVHIFEGPQQVFEEHLFESVFISFNEVNPIIEIDRLRLTTWQ